MTSHMFEYFEILSILTISPISCILIKGREKKSNLI